MGTRKNEWDKEPDIEDHPHAYGDKVTPPFSLFRQTGSSPRVWGQEMEALDAVPCIRIIPTRMGTRLSVVLRALSKEDHPHAYGDKTNILYALYAVRGSSPRVWGQGKRIHRLQALSGIIPTRMGTSECLEPLTAQCQDHPHAYGDKALDVSLISCCMGSSPRVWGQEYNHDVRNGRRRIIPTRMGTSNF